MAKKKSQAIYKPYPSYPSFSTIPAPLFPSSPTSYPEVTDYSKPFKISFRINGYPYKGTYSSPKDYSNVSVSRKTKTSCLSSKSTTTILLYSYLCTRYQSPTPPHTSSIGILQNSNSFTPLQDSSDSQTKSSTSNYSDDSSEAEIADISRIAMVRPGEDEEFDESYVEQPDDHVPRQDNNYKPTSGPWFTFDDLPYEKWRSRLQEFSAWIDLQITAQQIPLRQALQEFVSRFTGTLREWFQNMSPYEKLQAIQDEDAAVLLGAIHKEFIGDFNLI
ncbi:hypothetical protein K1719_042573 [Acacia pycnantha]|nr:hypothetical protein K1719_042573 [Acacia pycnantha]